MTALLVLDLFLANWGFYRRVDQKAFYWLSPNLQAVLSDPEKGRIYTNPLMIKVMVPRNMEIEELAQVILKECFYFDYPLVHRIFNTSGFGILTYQPYQDLLNILSEKTSDPRATDILRLMNAKFLLWPEAIPDSTFKLVHKGESYVLLEDSSKKILSHPPKIKMIVSHLYENKSVLPRAFLVSKYSVVRNGKERIELFEKKRFDPTQTVLLEEAPDQPRPTKGLVPDIDGVRLVNFALNQMDLDVSCTGPRLLFLSETYYPGWKVWVDGKREKIYRANHAFRAVALSPGRHSIIFKYQPFSFYFGLTVSSLTLMGLIVSLILLRRKSSYKKESEEYPCPPVI
ncbi:MAG: YfhO family protein [Deltaproteobacteria bacterium]|nr:YfhO family protein [Deltaproteobacteria bacterium]